ncbi:hypothetical protein WR25_18852 [Diploscapter pachys]|uniref:Nucleoporin NDC1 n=1 Tax=Diploscapter pachys TaxID=2018661 RepID=A0A2A2KAV1_9BILA|nr:hypothetical protein WR25_18852 [Diploscapter pachys]
MWSDSSPPSGASTSLLHNGVETSTPFQQHSLSGRRTAPIRKDDSLSFSRTPAHLPLSSASQSASMVDQIQQWFDTLISSRSVIAARVGAVVSCLIFSSAFFLLQLSIYSPIHSFYEAVWSLLSLRFILLFCIHGSIFFSLVTFFFYPVLFKVDQVRRVSYLNPMVWAVVALLALDSIVSTVLLLYSSKSAYLANGFPLFYLTLSLLSSTFQSIFDNDFQLTFSQHQKPKMLNFLLSLVLDADMVVQTSYTALKCMGSSMAFGLLLGTPLYGIRSVVCLVFPSLLLTVFCVSFMQLIAVRFFISIVRHIVMEPITFNMPLPYQIHSPTSEQMRTINRVVEARDPLLKPSNFYSHIQSQTHDQLEFVWIRIFSGGHARNWATLSTACVNAIKQVQLHLDEQSGRLFGGSVAVDNVGGSASGDASDLSDSLKIDREMLLMPVQARRQVYTSPVYDRHRKAVLEAPRRARPQTAWDKCVAKVSKVLSDEKYVVSPYDANLVILAIESLSMLIVYSYDEDRYGVVQKSLEPIIGQMLELIKSIDTYFRSRAAAAYSDAMDTTVRNMDVALFTAMDKIHVKFGPQLFKSLNLSPEQFRQIRSMCRSA